MISLVIFSVSATFAADNDTDAIAVDNEVIIDEPLAIDEDTSVISANETATVANTVTKETFNNYFNESGNLLANVTSEELTFSGDIADVGVDKIIIDRPITITGQNSTITNIAININANNVTIKDLTITQNNGTNAIVISNASNVVIESTTIDFTAIDGAEGYGINADLAENLKLLNNAVNYAGSTNGYAINNPIRVSNSNNAVVSGNKVNAKLISAPVGWAQVAGNWVSSPVSEGVVIDSSDNILFENNIVNLTCTNATGSYDTVYTVDVKNSKNAVVSGNEITSVGYTYIYGLILTGENFTIKDNTIDSSSDIYYANGIDIEGPSTGVVENNVISAKGVNLAYPIYAGMNNQPVSVNYTNNKISGEAYLVLGISLGDVESNVENNEITLNGNYTAGIATHVNNVAIKGNTINLTSSEQGNETVWETFGAETAGIKVTTGNATISDNVINTNGKGVSLIGDAIELSKNTINVIGNENATAYAIYATNVANLSVADNEVSFEGNTNGSVINNAAYINNSTAVISNNKFDISMPSVPIDWREEPAGSWNYVPYVFNEGILIDNSDNAVFENNTVKLNASKASGAYDTIYTVEIKNSANVTVSGNEIDATSNYTYIYGIVITGDNFLISENNINVEGNYYANGIDVEGPATGVIDNNVISAKAGTLVYPIYAGMNYQDVSANYTNNKLTGEGYLVLGFSLGDVKSVIANNTIDLTGNYTMGVASNVADLTVDGNKIILDASNEGNLTLWETFGADTVGVNVVSGIATVINNRVITNSEYTVKVADTNSSVHDNYLIAESLKGDASVNATGDAEIYNNTPSVKSVLSAADVEMVEGDGTNYVVIIKDENNNPLANKTISVIIINNTLTAVSDENGKATFALDLEAGIYNATAVYEGEGDFIPVNTTSVINVTAKPVDPTNATNITVPSAINTGDNATVTIDLPSDATGNVTVLVDGKEVETTNVNGTVSVPLDNLSVGAHLIEVKYDGDDKYLPASFASAIAVNDVVPVKKDTIITAEATLTRVANEHSKAGENGTDYFVTLTDVDGNPLANKTVQMAINGMIYNITTDNKGQAHQIINMESANVYTYAFSFQGDDDYNAAPLASTRLTVTKKSTSITAAAKSFKKSATKKYTVTLKTVKNADGKTYLASGKKITLKINGKTYTAKTNAKNQATFTIKLTKVGKFKAVIKYAGSKIYAASSKSVFITIKK